MSELREALIAAKANGEILKVRYDGGSQPGAVRELIPVLIGPDQARCRCYTSNAVKSFVIAKMTILDRRPTDGSEAVWTEPPPKVSRPEITLGEIEARYAAAWEEKGWEARIQSNEFGSVLGLHDLTRHGKRRASARIEIGHCPLTGDLMAQPDGSTRMENIRPSSRPWSLRRHDARTGTWSSCWPAISGLCEAIGIDVDEA